MQYALEISKKKKVHYAKICFNPTIILQHCTEIRKLRMHKKYTHQGIALLNYYKVLQI